MPSNGVKVAHGGVTAGGVMWTRTIALILTLAMPAAASAGPLSEAVEKAGKELSAEQTAEDTRGRARFWTGIALLGGGGVLTALGSVEIGDDEQGPDDGEDVNGSDDGEDSDGWGNKALIGGGIAAATVGGILLLTGRHKAMPAVSFQRGGVTVRQTLRF
jgi:hypothetical protein